MGRRPTKWTEKVRLSTPGLYWESRGSWQDSPKIKEMLLALDGTLHLNVRSEGKGQPNDIRIDGTFVRINRWPMTNAVFNLFKLTLELVPEGGRAVDNVLCQARELEVSHPSPLSSCDKLNHPRARSVRSVEFGQVSMDRCMTDLIPIIQNINIQRLDIVVPEAISLPPHSNYPDHTEVAIALREAIDHNFAITSTCGSGKCTPFTKPEDRCDAEGLGCPLGRFASSLTWMLDNIDHPYFLPNVDAWYNNARIAAIVWRNAELQRRVNSAVFHLLPFLRVTLNATGGQGRLPPEVMDRIADFVPNGVLSMDQVKRLREHATDREESRRVAQALKAGGTKEEWLFNGRFWWDKGYEAARAELGYDNTAWPPIENREAVLQFLAFPPVVSAWPYDRGDEVKEIMRKQERSE